MEQIVGIRKQAEVGVPVGERVRKVGRSEQTFWRWKKHSVGLEIDQVRQLRSCRRRTHGGSGWGRISLWTRRCGRMCWQRNSKALATPPGSGIAVRGLSGERAAGTAPTERTDDGSARSR